MPIGRPSGGDSGGGGGLLIVPSLPALEVIPKGAAVAALSNGIMMCSAQDHADQFIGFAIKDCATGTIVPIATTRGTVVTPLIESGGALVINKDVFLSSTRGRVTSLPQLSDIPRLVIRVGSAFSTSQFILATDMRIDLRAP